MAPFIAVVGMLAVGAIHRFLGDRGRAQGVRALFSGRLQLIAAWLASVFQSRAVDVATFPTLVGMNQVTWPGVIVLSCLFLGTAVAARKTPLASA